jgi:hypothetical protein
VIVRADATDADLTSAALELLAAHIAEGTCRLIGIASAQALGVGAALVRELALPPGTPLILVVLQPTEARHADPV